MANQFLVKETMAAMRGLSAAEITALQNGTYEGVQLLGYYQKGDTPAPIIYYLAPLTPDPGPDDGGSVIAIQSIKLIHKFEHTIHVAYFGASSSNSDNTPYYNHLINHIKDGQTIEFKGGEIYKGNFHAVGKSFNVNFNRCTLVPKVDKIGAFKVEGLLEEGINVTGYPGFNDESIEVKNSASFNIGDLILVKDEAVRQDGLKDQNQELFKIRKIEGNKIYIEGTIRATFNTGQVSVRRLQKLSNIHIKGGDFKDDAINTSPLLWIRYAENVIIDNIKVYNFYGTGVRLDSCYSGSTTNLYFYYPRATESGQGYGLALNESKALYANNIYGTHTRHVVDYKCTFDSTVENVHENNALSAAVVLAHNGFGGFIHCRNIFTSGASYSVAVSDQGFSKENLEVQVLRGYVIENVNHTWKDLLPPPPDGTPLTPNSVMSGISFKGDYADITIKNVTCNYDSSIDTSTISIDSNIIQFIGNKKGSVLVENIKSECVGLGIRDHVRTISGANNLYNSIYKDINIQRCTNVFLIKGNRNICIDGIFVSTIEDAVLRLERIGNQYPNYLDISSKGLSYTLRMSTSKLISDSSTMEGSMVKGSLEPTTAGSGSAVSLSNGGIIPKHVLFNAGKYLRIGATINSNIVLASDTPLEAGLWEGQEVNLVFRTLGITTETGTITIPTGSLTVENSSPIVMHSGFTYRFIFYGGKWRLISNSRLE
ncbi:hypothetical protein [Sphingobacterium detergens]|uniref:hypothetical protein n=1 Tax=Sphingobacterium detergens TaxID=1145106 RepID=UPI003AAAB06C